MTVMNNLNKIKEKIQYFGNVVADDSKSDRPEQICLTCRSVYGLIVQSLAWADSDEAEEIYSSIPIVIEHIDVGLEILAASDHSNKAEYSDSVSTKRESLVSIAASRNLEDIFEEIA